MNIEPIHLGINRDMTPTDIKILVCAAMPLAVLLLNFLVHGLIWLFSGKETKKARMSNEEFWRIYRS